MSDSTWFQYISPLDEPADDEDLGAIFQELVVGVTGLDPCLVRPRWQPQPPTQPPVETNWCAVGVTQITPTDYPQISQNEDLETARLHRLEMISVLASFYGPRAGSYAAILRDGIYMVRNRDTLTQKSGIKLRSADEVTHAPELINTQFVGRADLPMTFMRFAERDYVQAILVGAAVKVYADLSAPSEDLVIDLELPLPEPELIPPIPPQPLPGDGVDFSSKDFDPKDFA